MKEYIHFQGKTLGYIDYERKIYFSRRTINHVFVKFDNGFGISRRLLEYLDYKGIERIIIEFNNFLLETTTDKFWAWGIEWKDDTFGKEEIQIILPIQHFKESKNKEDIQMIL